MDEREVELIDYLRALWRQKWIIVVTFAAAVAAAWGASRAISPTYQTKTSLLLLPPLSSQLDAEAVGSRLAPEAYEELAVSTTLLQMVSEALEPHVSVSIVSLKSRLSVSVKRLSSEGELLLSATVRGSDPDWLPDIAEAWTASFAETYGELFQDRTARSYEYVNDNYAETQAELEALIEERTAFLSDHPLSILRAEASALEANLSSTQREVLKTEQELESVEAYLAARERNRTPELPTYVLTSDVDPYTLLGAIVFGLSASDYRDLIDDRIDDLERHAATISEELLAKQQETESLEATVRELDRRIALAEQAQATLAIKLQDAKIALAETPEPIRVIDEPLVPRSSIAPKKTSNIAIAGFLGLIVGTLLAFFVDYLARVRKQERATRLAATPGSETPRDRNADQKAQSPSEENRPNP
jgi:uncharacterized protein involved in exopolysaccharide biosynthesis